MQALNPYLHFDNNCEEAFNFYKSVFGGEFERLMRFKDLPPDYKMDEAESNKIIHVSLPMGQSILMGGDTPAAYGKTIIGGNLSISISATNKEEADKFHAGLSAGGEVTMPMAQTFWGAYFGMLKDKFGVQWMVSYDSNTPE